MYLLKVIGNARQVASALTVQEVQVLVLSCMPRDPWNVIFDEGFGTTNTWMRRFTCESVVGEGERPNFGGAAGANRGGGTARGAPPDVGCVDAAAAAIGGAAAAACLAASCSMSGVRKTNHGSLPQRCLGTLLSTCLTRKGTCLLGDTRKLLSAAYVRAPKECCRCRMQAHVHDHSQ